MEFNQQLAFDILMRYTAEMKANRIMDYVVRSVKEFYGMSEDLVKENEQKAYKRELEQAFEMEIENEKM